MLRADDRQVGGEHYKNKNPDQEHWNLVIYHRWDYFQAQIIKYVMRWKVKGGVQDLMKAQHFIDKYIEVAKHFPHPEPEPHPAEPSSGLTWTGKDIGAEPTRAYVDQG